ncbi:hypothetical protein HOE22_05200 [Candidatus Woesearchaeota archaeon]|jgi:hypothetical protein|nr:hypothetical protein [Candidatus Woesearchaeota archaeon]MBT4852213.1 hypothetical protein [Candidatus Neomarinimicrobiota bacterium]
MSSELIKKRIFPSVFDILGLKYILRSKCSWCQSGHDARSKYEITHSNYPSQLFYSMECYRNYDSYYYSNPNEKHQINKHSSLLGVSHNRLIGGVDTSENQNTDNLNLPDVEVINQYPKDFIINALIDQDFIINGKKCTIKHGSGSAHTKWVIRKGFWGEHIIQAKKLYKDELVNLYKQTYG